MAFLGLEDLLRSKETEREDDWRDIESLEEIRDERLVSSASDDQGRLALLRGLRTRKGFEVALREGHFGSPDLLRRAWEGAANPVTRAYLSPYVHQQKVAKVPRNISMLEEIILERLPGVAPGSARHLALVEAVRRLYKRGAMEADRLDKLRQD